jgi:hypothetical protein
MTVTGNNFQSETFFNGRGFYEIHDRKNFMTLQIFLPVNKNNELREDYRRNSFFFGSSLNENWGELIDIDGIEKKKIITKIFDKGTLREVFDSINNEEKIF